jgi:hypothetical protein
MWNLKVNWFKVKLVRPLIIRRDDAYFEKLNRINSKCTAFETKWNSELEARVY